MRAATRAPIRPPTTDASGEGEHDAPVGGGADPGADSQGRGAGHGDHDERGAGGVLHRQRQGQHECGHDQESSADAQEAGEQAHGGGGDEHLQRPRALAGEGRAEGDDRVVEHRPPRARRGRRRRRCRRLDRVAAVDSAVLARHGGRLQLAVRLGPTFPPTAELADAHQAADDEHQHGERRQEYGLGHVCGQLGSGGRAADRHDPEGDAAGEQHVAGAVRRHGADQRGEADHHQRTGGGLRRALAQGVDQHRDREDRAAATERSQAEADERAGDQCDEEGHAASGPHQVQPDLLGVVEGVVDRHQLAAGGVEHRRGDRGAVAGFAVHPHLAGGDLVEPVPQLVQGDVDGVADRCGGVLLGASNVQDHHVAVVPDVGEVGEGGRREAGQLTVRPVLRRAGGVGGGTVDADADQLALGLGHDLRGLPEQGDRRAPGDQPAEVGREGAVETEVQGAACMPGRERGAVAQVDHPLAGLDPPAELGGVRECRRAEIGLRGPGRVGGSHVRVVGGPGAEAVEQLADVGLLVLGEHRVGPLLLADGRVGGLGLRGRAERPEAVGREDAGLVGEQVGEPVGRGVLVTDQRVGVLSAEQVRAPGGAVEQRASGEHADGAVEPGCVGAAGVGQGVGEVGEGVPGSRQRGHPHPAPDLDGLRVADRGALEGDLVGGVDVVRRAGAPGQRQPTGHVVVVDVGLEDVGEPDTVLLEQVQHPVDVALRVHHERDLAVVDEVAAVTQGGCLDRDDGEVVGRSSEFLLRRGGPNGPRRRCRRRTDQASKPACAQQVGHGQGAVPGGADDVDGSWSGRARARGPRAGPSGSAARRPRGRRRTRRRSRTSTTVPAGGPSRTARCRSRGCCS